MPKFLIFLPSLVLGLEGGHQVAAINQTAETDFQRFLAELTYCEVDNDCQGFPYEVCKSDTGDTPKKVCKHKHVFLPTGLEIAGWFVLPLLLIVTNVGGIGGGFLAIPVVQLFFRFDAKAAVAITSMIIFTSTLASFIANFKKKHPQKPNVVLIDYPIVTIMMPLVLAGSQLGGLMLIAFPAIVTQWLLVVMLVFMTVQTAQIGIKIMKKENE